MYISIFKGLSQIRTWFARGKRSQRREVGKVIHLYRANDPTRSAGCSRSISGRGSWQLKNSLNFSHTWSYSNSAPTIAMNIEPTMIATPTWAVNSCWMCVFVGFAWAYNNAELNKSPDRLLSKGWSCGLWAGRRVSLQLCGLDLTSSFGPCPETAWLV